MDMAESNGGRMNEKPMKLTPGAKPNFFRPSMMFPAFLLKPVQGAFPFAPGALGPIGFGTRFQPHKVYGRIGNLEVRLARTKGDIKRAQRLRYKVFYEEMAAIPDALAILSRRDEDVYDSIFDHLLVVDHGNPAKGRRWGRPKVVGTYRVLRQDIACRNDGFYTQGEYDIAPLLRARPDHNFIELGRSCVLKPYRNKRTLELLWQGVWGYVREHGGNVMIGCASFPGTDPSLHAQTLSYLHHMKLAPAEWRVRAYDRLRVDMNMLPREAVDMRAAVKALPPLIKGYLRVGAFVGDGAAIDHQFGTTDVFVIMPVEAINTRYFDHFGAPDALVTPVEQDFAALN
jgi:putative hemolysin